MNSFVIVVLALVAAAQANAVYKKLQVEERVVGGKEAVPNSIPYQALIEMQDGSFTRSYCGGTLVTPTKVLTAAHCITDNIMFFNVYLGAHNITKGEKNRQVISVNKFDIHNKFNKDTYANDIAVLTLSWPALLDEYVQVVKLPSRGDSSKTFAGEQATVSGWGRTSDAPFTSDVLKFAASPVITNEECSKDFEDVLSTQICVDGKSKNAPCLGDSGGPLVVGKDRVQIGIVSYTKKIGCRSGKPTVYTRLTKYLDWLATHAEVQIN